MLQLRLRICSSRQTQDEASEHWQRRRKCEKEEVRVGIYVEKECKSHVRRILEKCCEARLKTDRDVPTDIRDICFEWVLASCTV